MISYFRKSALLLVISLTSFGCNPVQSQTQEHAPYDSGGYLIPEQAAYDVNYYDLTLDINPADSSISGTLAMTATITSPAAEIVMDLDPILAIHALEEEVKGGLKAATFTRESGRVRIRLHKTKQPGDVLKLVVTYGGVPRVAPNPPWDGGFTWASTEDGSPWIATTCQTIGADVWWPVKDHVSDEPDSMSLHITVPKPLVVASNGRLTGTEDHGDKITYNWFISNPINVYNVALNIAPYRTIETTYKSIAGDTFPVVFYVLPEDYEKGLKLFPEILDHLSFFEETVGPYPFRADKYGVAQTPHLGMEHQTIIAYGANFDNGSMTGGVDFGYDALHHHELAHEWWGNLVTNIDWSDMWLHEGFGTYMQPLYREKLAGTAAYHEQMARSRRGIQNEIPVAPRGVLSSQEIYGGDIYSKGAWVLHTLRYLIGEEQLRQSLKLMAYPEPEMLAAIDGSQTRFVTTDDYKAIVEELSGRNLDWYFEMYIRQPRLPRLHTQQNGTQLTLSWETPDDLPFPMPVDVSVDGKTQRVEFGEMNEATIQVPESAKIVVDPMNWILKEEQ